MLFIVLTDWIQAMEQDKSPSSPELNSFLAQSVWPYLRLSRASNFFQGFEVFRKHILLSGSFPFILEKTKKKSFK